MIVQSIGDLKDCVQSEDLPKHGIVIDATREELKALPALIFREVEVVPVGTLARVKELEAVVSRLPKTIDGVPCAHGDVIWNSKIEPLEAVAPLGMAWVIKDNGEGGQEYVGFGQITKIAECYSTRAAAEAAKGAS